MQPAAPTGATIVHLSNNLELKSLSRRSVMQKFLLYSSALVVLSGVAEAACIQTPTCSSLGYTSSQSCSGGIKCPFGNAWNCTAANNTTEITNLKTEVTNLKTQISAINTNITNITNRVTNIENNTSSSNQYSDACIGCVIGNYYASGKCYTRSDLEINHFLSEGYVVSKRNGKCYYYRFGSWATIPYNEWLERKDSADTKMQMQNMCNAVSLAGGLNKGFIITASVKILNTGTTENPRYRADFRTESCGDVNIEATDFGAKGEEGQSLEDFKNNLRVPWFPEPQTF